MFSNKNLVECQSLSGWLLNQTLSRKCNARLPHFECKVPVMRVEVIVETELGIKLGNLEHNARQD